MKKVISLFLFSIFLATGAHANTSPVGTMIHAGGSTGAAGASSSASLPGMDFSISSVGIAGTFFPVTLCGGNGASTAGDYYSLYGYNPFLTASQSGFQVPSGKYLYLTSETITSSGGATSFVLAYDSTQFAEGSTTPGGVHFDYGSTAAAASGGLLSPATAGTATANFVIVFPPLQYVGFKIGTSAIAMGMCAQGFLQ